jgi:protein-tyrosine phosphatase
MKVLFVCTGNLCRSPMAEGLLRHELENRGCDDIEVVSAGTWAVAGDPATDEAIAVSENHDVDISSHLSRPVDAEELDGADLVLAMTGVHLQEIASIVPEARFKTMLLNQMAQTKPAALGPDASLEERVQALLEGNRPRWRRKMDVADPIGRPLRFYERCFAELQGAIKILADILCPDEVPP